LPNPAVNNKSILVFGVWYWSEVQQQRQQRWDE
jgi:hypothetical protein